MHIILAPNPVLRETCEDIKPEELKKLKSTARAMAKLMYKSNGCGLAGPQVGLLKRIIVVDCNLEEDAPKDPQTIINPVLVSHGEATEVNDEACLSIPGISVPVERYTEVVVEALDLEGETVVYEVDGFYARCLQHEMDHLEGDTLFERLDPIARIQAFKEYEEALAAGARPGDVSSEGR